MMNGPGKYDPECQKILEEVGASSVLLIVRDGNRGTGFSVKGEMIDIFELPETLERVAEELRAMRTQLTPPWRGKP
jgi:hypothetical protein